MNTHIRRYVASVCLLGLYASCASGHAREEQALVARNNSLRTENTKLTAEHSELAAENILLRLKNETLESELQLLRIERDDPSKYKVANELEVKARGDGEDFSNPNNSTTEIAYGEMPAEGDRSVLAAGAPPRFELVEVDDLSYKGTKRALFRVMFIVDQLPTMEDVQIVAKEIWDSKKTSWDELSSAVYLPGMDTASLAYAMVEYSANGTPTCTLSDLSLWGTGWYEQTPTAKRHKGKQSELDALWAIQRKDPKSIDCSLVISAVIEGQQLAIMAETNLPEGTLVSLWVYRQYWERGSSSSYAHEYFSEDLSLSGGQIRKVLVVNDGEWKKSLDAKLGRFKSIGVASTVQRIADEIEISLMYTSHNDSHPPNVREMLGDYGEFVGGPQAKRVGKGTVLKAEQTIGDRFDG